MEQEIGVSEEDVCQAMAQAMARHSNPGNLGFCWTHVSRNSGSLHPRQLVTSAISVGRSSKHHFALSGTQVCLPDHFAYHLLVQAP